VLSDYLRDYAPRASPGSSGGSSPESGGSSPESGGSSPEAGSARRSAPGRSASRWRAPGRSTTDRSNEGGKDKDSREADARGRSPWVRHGDGS
jgi:hypothetical protein